MTLRRPRLIPRLAVKGDSVVITVNMEGLRKVGKPADLAKQYAEQNIDELIYLDVVASLYGRNQLEDLLSDTVESVFVPITVGGGVKTLDHVKRLMDAGADKVSINTGAIENPRIIEEIAGKFGSQAIVVSIEAKRAAHGWEAYTENGRQRTGKDAVAWAFEAVKLGAGELLVTSIDREGTRRGCDLDLIRAVVSAPVPVIAHGGIGRLEDVLAISKLGVCIAMSSALHTNVLSIKDMRDYVSEHYH